MGGEVVQEPKEIPEGEEVIPEARTGRGLVPDRVIEVGIYKILFYFEAYVHESIIFFANTTFVWAPHSPPSPRSLLRNILFPRIPHLLQYILYNIVNDNIV